MTTGQDPETTLRRLVQLAEMHRRAFPRTRFQGLEPVALQVLCALELQPERSVTEVAEQLALDRRRAGHAFAQLRERRLLRETEDPSDRRRHPHRPTAKGSKLVASFLNSLPTELQAALGKMKGPRSIPG